MPKDILVSTEKLSLLVILLNRDALSQSVLLLLSSVDRPHGLVLRFSKGVDRPHISVLLPHTYTSALIGLGMVLLPAGSIVWVGTTARGLR